MRFENVEILAVSHVAPPVAMTSAQVEEALHPLYERLHLPEGRLELMTGIRERRLWWQGTLPSDGAVLAAKAAIAQAGLSREAIQQLIFCGVSHDFTEPATAAAVTAKLLLGQDVVNFDISNACLGVASGMMTLAQQIEAGQLECGIAVTGENGWPLVANTINALNGDLSQTRQSIKDQFASLTIGSAAAAVILGRRGHFGAGRHLLRHAVTASDCRASVLCQGESGGAMTDASRPVMKTDSHELMVRGIAVAHRMWQRLCEETGWGQGGSLPDIVCGHQVGKVHRDALFQELGLPVELDFPTFPEFGNCGSASLPLTVSLAAERGALKAGLSLALLGPGSGINAPGMDILW